jgi:hypothetical protein
MKKSYLAKYIKTILSTSVVCSSLVITASVADTYRVIDTGNVDIVEYTYAQQYNNAGQAILSGVETYNFPVQFQYLDDDDFDIIESMADNQHELRHDLGPLEDRDALEAGEPTANDLSWTLLFLQSQGNSDEYQKYGDTLVLHNIFGDTEELRVFDTGFDGDPDAAQLTRSTVDYATGITPSGVLFGSGSAPYLPLEWVDGDGDDITYWLRSFSSKAFVSLDGVTITGIEAPENTYGGRSAILDMNDSMVAVGNASIGLNDYVVEERILDDGSSDCSNENNLEDEPFEVCVQRYESSLYHENAYQWTILGDGSVVGKDLGTLITNRHEDDERAFLSTAVAINENGIAVGYSHNWFDKDETNPSKNESRRVYAAIYTDEGNIDFTDHDEWLQSRALDINDNDIVVGAMEKYINGSPRTKFYYADMNADEIVPVFPEDFFNGSASVAQAINNNGMIVGEGEVETHNDSSAKPRRRHGFIYDINTDTFTDINDFLTCDSAYTIVEVRDINDANEIFATALVQETQRDSKGEPILDDNGEVKKVDVLRAVVLEPIPDGTIDDCSEVEEKVERQGASLGLFATLLLAFAGIRRRFRY